AHLEPDLIGEHQIASLDRNAVDLIEGCLRWIEGEPEADRSKRRRNLITVLQRATRPEHGAVAGRASDLLDHLIRSNTAIVAAEMIATAIETPGALLSLLVATVPALDEDSLATVYAALPLQSLVLMDLALAVAERRLALARLATAPTGATNDRPAVAR